MASFRAVRAAIAECYANGGLDDEEFMLLYDVNRSRNPEFPYDNDEHFDLEALDESECKAEFRFEKAQIVPLSQILGVPEKIVCNQGTQCSGIEGLCILLRRLVILVAIPILCSVFPDQFLNLA